ncbi:MAG: phosphoethanolamine transferase [Arenicella sp.]
MTDSNNSSFTFFSPTLKAIKVNSLKRIQLSPIGLTLLFSAYFLLVFNTPFWTQVIKGVETLNEVNYFFFASIPLTLWALLTIVLLFFCIKYLQKPLLFILSIVAACACFATTTYGIVFDAGMIANIFETSNREALSYFSFRTIAHISLLLVFPVLLLLKTQIIYKSPVMHIAHMVRCVLVCLIVIAINGFFFYPNYASFFRDNNHVRDVINPSSYIRQSIKYVKNHYILPPAEHRQIGMDATAKKTSQARTIVIVLGETARAMNYPAAGYQRQTTRHTNDIDMVHIADVDTCGTATTISLPCMFSKLTRKGFDKKSAIYQDNVLDIIQRGDYQVTWIENSDGCKDVCRRIGYEGIPPKKEHPLCDGMYCYDEILLEKLDAELSKTRTSAQDRLIVLHVMGSHGPTYYKRYPDSHRQFTPDCQRSDIQNCTRQELVNTYDNTILYTDFIVASSIRKLKSLKQDAMLMYISDHGESLGEKGVYLHGLPYAIAPIEQKKVPWQLWFSSQYINNTHLSKHCLRKQTSGKTLSHDHFFHTLLAASGVSTVEYDKKLDILQGCQR